MRKSLVGYLPELQKACVRLKILISAGPTRELMDPVRYISNRSSGKMGYALAEAAMTQGHQVKLISGPVHLLPPKGVKMELVETAQEMRCAILKDSKNMDLMIMTAAVADYQPLKMSRHKIKKGVQQWTLKLKKTPDILAELGRIKTSEQLLIGFAAETERLLRNAKEKLIFKNLDFIVANRVGVGVGFDSDYNQVWILSRNGKIFKFARMTKRKLAQRLIAFWTPYAASRKV